jgi:endonuclease YncB( thermonuclease family)
VNVSVKSVVDGDTVWITNEAGQSEKVRLSQIDAPEKSQAYGIEATRCLSNLLANTSVSVCRDGKDRYGRTIAALKANGIDVGNQMVAQGCAWAYTKYLEAGSSLPMTQMLAQSMGVGLWAGSAQAPWEYRGGTQPVTVSATGATPFAVNSATTATPFNRVLDWAEHALPELLHGGTANQTAADGTVSRCYATNWCVQYRNGRFFTVFGGSIVTDVGAEADWLQRVSVDGF